MNNFTYVGIRIYLNIRTLLYTNVRLILYSNRKESFTFPFRMQFFLYIELLHHCTE